MRKLLIKKIIPGQEKFEETAIEPLFTGRTMYGAAVITRVKIERNGFVFDYGIKSQGFSHLLDKPIKRRTTQAKVFEDLASMMIRELNLKMDEYLSA